MTDPANEIRNLPTGSITVVNPRLRSKRVFSELVESVAAVGLKKPITVRRRPDGSGYDLVCGQGRLEAFLHLGQTEIPAIVTDEPEEDCFLKGLVENLARRQHLPLEIFREIEALVGRGYRPADIAEKTGLSVEYVNSINMLLTTGEHRLLKAVDKGVVPHSIAIEIARAGEPEVQAALQEAYERKTLPGNRIAAIRRIIELRKNDRKGGPRRPRTGGKQAAKVTSDSLVRAYTKEIARQKLMVKKANLAQARLQFVVNGLRKMLADRNFETLLRAERVVTMPQQLSDLIGAIR